MLVDDLDYPFDPSLVAREPVEPRDAARLLVYHRATGAIEHRQVRDIVDYLRSGDTLVVNKTTVAPARIKACRLDRDGREGAHIEGLLLERRDARHWIALLKNAKRTRAGERLALIGPARSTASAYGLVIHRREGNGVLVSIEGGESADAVLAEVGWTPLPPYILKARKDGGRVDDGHDDADDRRHYQTVFAAPTETPSVAAPTAGLHFTPELLGRVDAIGVSRIGVELQVGAGTFKPIETVSLADHPMHRERCVVPYDALTALHRVVERGGRVIAVGTTSVRTLESLPSPLPNVEALLGSLVWETDLLISPGFQFRYVGALLTNFHLPRSTLLALVAAMIGLDELKRVYATAISERYRFYSYGDAMLVL